MSFVKLQIKMKDQEMLITITSVVSSCTIWKKFWWRMNLPRSVEESRSVPAGEYVHPLAIFLGTVLRSLRSCSFFRESWLELRPRADRRGRLGEGEGEVSSLEADRGKLPPNVPIVPGEENVLNFSVSKIRSTQPTTRTDNHVIIHLKCSTDTGFLKII